MTERKEVWGKERSLGRKEVFENKGIVWEERKYLLVRIGVEGKDVSEKEGRVWEGSKCVRRKEVWGKKGGVWEGRECIRKKEGNDWK